MMQYKLRWYEKTIYPLIVCSSSIIQVLIIISVKDKSHLLQYDLYFAAIPVFFLLIGLWFSNSKKLIDHSIYNVNFLYLINISFVFTVVLYLLSIVFDYNITNKKAKVLILLICFLVISASVLISRAKINNEALKPKNKTKTPSKILFNTYYINISKVFEIAMLINNKIITSGQNEKTLEENESIVKKLNANINIEYLKQIKNGISFENNITKTNSEKNKVLENFDVKTTKSNLLEMIINESRDFNINCKVNQGDLLIFKDVKIELINQEETMQIMKFLLNGAFNGSKVSGSIDEMQMEINISSLISSFLKDCSYELKCTIKNFEFFIKIPMSFENDFENAYNIYDLLIGKMTVIGIFRGRDTVHKHRSFSEFLTNSQPASPIIESSTNNQPSQIPELKKSSSKKDEVISNLDGTNEIEHDNNDCEQNNYVDVIAIIQDINLQ